MLLLLVYGAVALRLAATKDFTDRGPLSVYVPALKAPLPDAIPLDVVPSRCFPDGLEPGLQLKIVGATVAGAPYYACYQLDSSSSTPFTVQWAAVIDGQGFTAVDSAVIKRSGAWPWIGLVKTPGELVLGGVGLAVALWVCWRYYRRMRPPVRHWQGRALLTVMIIAPLASWWLALLPLRSVDRAQRLRVLWQAVLVWGWLTVAMLLAMRPAGDTWAAWVIGLLAFGLAYGVLGGRRLLAPPGFGLLDVAAAGDATRAARPEAAIPQPPAGAGDRGLPGVPAPGRDVVPGGGGPLVTPGPPAATLLAGQRDFLVIPPAELPTFADVGGMEALKTELRETVGLLLAFAGEADAYRIGWNGILLHGPPGAGKTFLAKAVAGEFGLNLLQVATGDLVSPYVGGSAANVERTFQTAASSLPCLLFVDEFDSVGQRRDDSPDQEARRTVNQLLQSLERYRRVRELLVVAATNDLQRLDPAVIRPGRFDRHVRIDLPDTGAREAILAAQLRGRPATRLDLGELARRTRGLSAAAITQVVDLAALTAFQEASRTGAMVQITMTHLLDALSRHGGSDRPTVEEWDWDHLVLPDHVIHELREIEALVRDPERAHAYGVTPPSGLLLTGPPGTGKTTIAKVLAAQARCSFYPVSGGDLTSKWLGESEQRIQQLFERACANRPSIIFIDEIDSIAGPRDDRTVYGPQVNELLNELDGVGSLPGVLVIGATNRPDRLDPALLRGGRLSRRIEIPLPDQPARRRLLELKTARMPLVAVDLDTLTARTEGLSGADLQELCQQAAVNAMVRSRQEADAPDTPAVHAVDFEAALAKLRRPGGTGQTRTTPGRAAGQHPPAGADGSAKARLAAQLADLSRRHPPNR